MIKNAIGIILFITSGLAFALAQGTNLIKPAAEWHSGDTAPRQFGPYDKKRPPLLSFGDAYNLALSGLGSDTNQYYCVSANCLDPAPTFSNFGMHGMKGWTFNFFNTNGVQRQVVVYFDKATWVQPEPKPGGAGF